MTAMKDRCSRRSIITTCAVVAVSLFAAGCGDDDDEGSADAAKPTTFAITATAEGAKKKVLEFPSTIKAGLVAVTLRNSDKDPRSAQLIRVTGDQTVDDVLKIVEAEEATKIPSFMQDGGGLGTVKPGETATATQVLAPGKWVIWDDEGGDGEGPGNSDLGAKGEFTVTGPASDAELPKQAATVTATDEGEGKEKEYSFEFDGLKAGTNAVRFENTGDELHHALFFPMNKGATLKQVEKFISTEGEAGGPPPIDFESGVGTTVIDGGIAQNVSLDIKAGKYAVICFISDRAGGKPHAAKGMLKELAIE